MKILNFGSLNIDHVYRLPHFVRPGETLAALEYSRFPGGKGANQSIALARAGAEVLHAGRIGADGVFLREMLESEGVDCRFLLTGSEPTGHAVIQVTAAGENAILLFGGANQAQTREQIDAVFAAMDAGDFLLLQNEISLLPDIIRAAAAKHLKIVFNPAPMNETVFHCPLELVNLFVVNEIEGAELAGLDSGNRTLEWVIDTLRRKFPQAGIVMTLGAAGAWYAAPDAESIVRIPACRAEKVVDTTAAGDTFIGYLLAGIAAGESVPNAMRVAAKASAITVSRPGAATSIPRAPEVQR